MRVQAGRVTATPSQVPGSRFARGSRSDRGARRDHVVPAGPRVARTRTQPPTAPAAVEISAPTFPRGSGSAATMPSPASARARPRPASGVLRRPKSAPVRRARRGPGRATAAGENVQEQAVARPANSVGRNSGPVARARRRPRASRGRESTSSRRSRRHGPHAPPEVPRGAGPVGTRAEETAPRAMRGQDQDEPEECEAREDPTEDVPIPDVPEGQREQGRRRQEGQHPPCTPR